ncbi:MAG: recombination mediator RecR [Candidatus Dojkabacteria bacterium]|nr:MAG: recombination mediator RecR [Candidatus Dojkabacteria bacterium]
MSYLPKSVQKVIEEFERLPGVGAKSAARMAYHYIRSSNQDAVRLADALKEMDEKVVNCSKCYNVAEKEVCDICSNSLREQNKLCIVEEPLDVVAFESSAIFNGLYFVIGGVISPADGIGPDELRFKELQQRVNQLVSENESIEIIVATNPSLEGEATANHIQEVLQKLISEEKVKITRLATGLPTGADLEYADRLTLKRALEGRRNM